MQQVNEAEGRFPCCAITISQNFVLVKRIKTPYNISEIYILRGGPAMNNTDMETFWAVLEHGTLTAAAEALFITQPTLDQPHPVAGGGGGRAAFPPGQGHPPYRADRGGAAVPAAGLPLADAAGRDEGRGGDGHTGISADRRGVFHQPVHSSGGVPPLSPPEAAGGPVGADPAWRRLRWRPDGGPP